MEKMLRNTLAAAALMAAVLMIGCGTSSDGPNGSRKQAMTGVTASGYPAGQPTDPGSPALGSSTEQKYSREQEEEAKAGEHAGHEAAPTMAPSMKAPEGKKE